MNQEERDDNVVDEMNREVDSRDGVMHCFVSKS